MFRACSVTAITRALERVVGPLKLGPSVCLSVLRASCDKLLSEFSGIVPEAKRTD